MQGFEVFDPPRPFEEPLRAQHRAAAGPAAPDWRVAKGLGSKGYAAVRLSLVAGPDAPRTFRLDGREYRFTYAEPFRYRWQGGYDLGISNSTCGTDMAYSATTNVSEAECLKRCNLDGVGCKYYTWDSGSNCLLHRASADCGSTRRHAKNSWLTTKQRDNVLYSVLIPQFPASAKRPAVLHYEDSTGAISETAIRLPLENARVQGIVWSDPCVSGRWTIAFMGRSGILSAVVPRC